MARKVKIMENEKYTVGRGIWKNHSKLWKMKNAHCRMWSMTRKLKIMVNEKHTLQEVKYGEKY